MSKDILDEFDSKLGVLLDTPEKIKQFHKETGIPIPTCGCGNYREETSWSLSKSRYDNVRFQKTLGYTILTLEQFAYLKGFMTVDKIVMHPTLSS